MIAAPDVPVSRTNPHFRVGESPASHARRRGWNVGTRLVGDDGSGPTIITITSIGKEAVLACADNSNRDHLWGLACRDWQPLLSDASVRFDMDAIGHMAATHGLTGEQLLRGAEALHRYEEAQRDPEAQGVYPMTDSHVHAALRVLATLNLSPL